MGAKESRIGFLSYDEALRRGEGEGGMCGGPAGPGVVVVVCGCGRAPAPPVLLLLLPLCPCQRAVRRGGVWRFLTPP